jgi:toxin YoeB
MARRIVWTSKADIVFTRILEFYVERNGSKTYSRKLNREINEIIKLLLEHPYLGTRTDFNEIRVLIQGDFKIFYQLKPKELIILLVWDCRQNPNMINDLIR